MDIFLHIDNAIINISRSGRFLELLHLSSSFHHVRGSYNLNFGDTGKEYLWVTHGVIG